MTLPKFIRIERTIGEVLFINVNEIVQISEYKDAMEFEMTKGYILFDGDDYPIAKAAWLEYWKVSP